jgi:hypothetical protein
MSLGLTWQNTRLKGEPTMLHGLFGNASELDSKELQRELDATLIEGEKVIKAFNILRDLFIFTDKRLLLVAQR